MNEHKNTNNLINETSVYLLQHAHNPVNWYAWGKDALKIAKEEDKPILVSIGYSACHWCHVMERESFEDEAIAKIMNENFINIKIDREERPDIDHIYMDAVQTLTGSGGWPLNVFLTPDLKPFYGGTYFPPKPMANRNSWQQILVAVAHAYKEKKVGVIQQAESLTQHLQNANLLNLKADAVAADKMALQTIAENLVKIADTEWGGFGQAPKFPQTFSILYLLRYHFLTKNKAALDTAILSIDKMMLGGIYDQLGGGFCRYSTDRRWQIPHFEKMLYDNALLIDVYTEAYQLTNNECYKVIVNETIQFIKDELTSSEGGFYSALDADSEGVEGKYYVWDKKEIDDLLGSESQLFCSVYNISEIGNWEETNILWQPEKVQLIASRLQVSEENLVRILNNCRQILFDARQKRIKPGLDNKVILSWNALAIISLCKAYAAFQDESYLFLAKRNIDFIERQLFDVKTGYLFHSWNINTNSQQAFLDDYATLIKAYIFLFQVTAETDYLRKARLLTEKCIEDFSDEDGSFFYFTSKEQEDILLRKIELYDGATPSGNALMAENLYKLAIYFNVTEWRQKAEKMIDYVGQLAKKYPTSFGRWSLNMLSMVHSIKEIVITAGNFRPILKQVLKEYIPFKIVQAAGIADDNWPLLQGKVILPNQTKIYICQNYNCLQPATSFEKFKNQLFEDL